MTISRRRFLQTSAALASLTAFSKSAFAEEIQKTKGLSIMQGATDDRNTQISVMHKKSQKLNFKIRELATGSEFNPSFTKFYSKSFSNDGMTHVYINNLNFEHTYQLNIFDEKNNLLDSREFGLVNTRKNSLNFSLGSCMLDYMHWEGIWRGMEFFKPEVFFLIGDAVYADRISVTGLKPANPERLWQRYVDGRNTMTLYFFKRLIPVFATWDDHDYGYNNSDMTYPYKKEALETFNIFFPQDAEYISCLKKGPGVSCYYSLCGQNFFLMDNRTFRTPIGQTKDETHWGFEQESWLYQNLQNNLKPTWLMSGSQYWGGYRGNDCYEGWNPNNFKDVMGRLAQIKAPIVFCSGDVHYSEIMKIEKEIMGYTTLEVTSSSIHSMTTTGIDNQYKNPRRIVSTWEHNYKIISATAAESSMAGIISACAQPGKVFYTRQFEVDLEK